MVQKADNKINESRFIGIHHHCHAGVKLRACQRHAILLTGTALSCGWLLTLNGVQVFRQSQTESYLLHFQYEYQTRYSRA